MLRAGSGHPPTNPGCGSHARTAGATRGGRIETFNTHTRPSCGPRPHPVSALLHGRIPPRGKGSDRGVPPSCTPPRSADARRRCECANQTPSVDRRCRAPARGRPTPNLGGSTRVGGSRWCVGRSNAPIVHGRCGTNDNPACAHSAPYPFACSVTCIPPGKSDAMPCRRVGGGHPGGGGFRRSRYVRGRIVLWQRCSRLNLGPLPTSSTVRVSEGLVHHSLWHGAAPIPLAFYAYGWHAPPVALSQV